MSDALGLLETTGLTPAMVAVDVMIKSAAVRVLQLELNDLYGVCVKIDGATADVTTAVASGRKAAEVMGGRPVAKVISRVARSAMLAILSPPEYNPLIQQAVVFPTEKGKHDMNKEQPAALGFIETQGFIAVIEAIDTACKAADVAVVGKEKLGGGYVTVVIQGELSAVSAAIEDGKASVDGLGKLIAAHVIARPSPAITALLPKL